MHLEQSLPTIHHRQNNASVEFSIVDVKYDCDLFLGKIGNLRRWSHSSKSVYQGWTWINSLERKLKYLLYADCQSTGLQLVCSKKRRPLQPRWNDQAGRPLEWLSVMDHQNSVLFDLKNPQVQTTVEYQNHRSKVIGRTHRSTEGSERIHQIYQSRARRNLVHLSRQSLIALNQVKNQSDKNWIGEGLVDKKVVDSATKSTFKIGIAQLVLVLAPSQRHHLLSSMLYRCPGLATEHNSFLSGHG